MEGKGVRTFLISLFILGFVAEQTKVEAAICCRIGTQQDCFDICRLTPLGCAHKCDCLITAGPFCPYTHPQVNTLQKSDNSEQTKVEATPPICCRNGEQRFCFDRCRLSAVLCAFRCGCDFTAVCPRTQPEISTPQKIDDVINGYCKLGCASSVCNTISTLGNSGKTHSIISEEEEVKKAMEHCNNACSEFCATKGSTLAQVVTA